MESKFTPGPWVISDIGRSEHGSLDIYNNEGKWLAEALGTHVGPSTKEEVRANAHLIAAAPDMFEVIKEMCDWAIMAGIEGPIFPKLQAAYFKATGQLIAPIENQ